MTDLKKFYQKLFPFLGASFSLIPSESMSNAFSEILNQPKEVIVHAKLSKKSSNQKEIEKKENLVFEHYKKDLNQTKVYLLVNKDQSQENPANKLCLLENVIYLNSHLENMIPRFLKCTYGCAIPSKKHNYSNYFYKHGGYLLSDPDKSPFGGEAFSRKAPALEAYNILLIRDLDSADDDKYTYPIDPTTFRGGATYYVYSEPTDKPICPIFSSVDSAEEFLTDKIKRRKENEYDLETIENLEETKIISLGLGDFIEYYFNRPTLKNKIDFLLIPDFEKLKYTKTEVRIMDMIKFIGRKEHSPDDESPPFIVQSGISKNFKDYEKEFHKYKEMN